MYGGVSDCSVLDVVLGHQTLQGVYGGLHSVHSEEGGQVGGVGGCDDEGEEPPETAHDACSSTLRVQIAS